jgi:hypothetical protein
MNRTQTNLTAMRKIIPIRSFLLGFLCLALFSAKGDAQRALEVSKSQLINGCAPFGNKCPSYMYCLVDGNYKTWGQCTCNGFHSKQQKPPVNNGLELAPPLTMHDCELVPLAGHVAVFYWFCFGLVGLRFMIGSMMVALKVFKKGAAKFTSSYIGLVSIALHELGITLRGLGFVIYRLQWDPSSIFWDWVRPVYGLLETNFGYFLRYEILCTWVDLLEKSVKLSKNTSAAMKVLRIMTRTVGIATLGFTLMTNIPALRGSVSFKTATELMVNLQVPFLGGTCLFLAPVLVRILCKDMRDVTHPNWKAAAAIRRAAIGEILQQIFLPGANRFFLKHNIHADWGGVHGEAMMFIMFYYICVSDAEWLGYLLFAHRKYLHDENESTSKITNFLGFSTLALNGSVSSQIMSRVTGKSSVMTESSVDEPEKKELA